MSNEIWDKQWKAICERVKSVTSKDTPIIFSAYNSDEEGNPIDNLDTVAIKGAAIIVADAADEFWGGPDSKPFESEVLTGPTWLQLCATLHEQIECTGDRHHVCIEGLEKVGQKTVNGKRVFKYEILLGS